MTRCAPDSRRGFDPHPSSVGEARRLVREELRRAGREDLVETAELLVTELVTNALVHTSTRMELGVVVDEAGLYVEVADGSPQLPVVRHHADLAGTGRGLRLLQHMADRWGAEPRDRGKAVWFELSSAEHADEWLAPTLTDRDLEMLVRDDVPGSVPVELLNVPLLLHLAWNQHAEALLREYLLATLAEDDLDVLELHAAASEAMALLVDQLPDPAVGEDPDQLMSNAVEPVVSRPRVVVRVPEESLDRFRVLDETIEAALVLADAGEFLNAPTQPEIRTFRRWVCGEVAHQSRGSRPRPWADQSDAAPPDAAPLPPWDLDAVISSPEAAIAADDTDGIVAVSAAALRTLGYTSPEELIGRRLLAIIPPRFRQAHLAGFTMHLASGRSPLLSRPVRVPALRRDGTEVTVELTVEPHPLPGGRHTYVATLRP